MEQNPTEKNALERNFRVEYVLLYNYKDAEPAEASRQLKDLIYALSGVGLETAIRPASESSLFVFVKAPKQKLRNAVHKSRTKDWLYGIRQTQPQTDDSSNTGPATPAEHLRIVYEMMTMPKRKGGAGITPRQGEWKHVESIFPLHDNERNKQWIKDWSQKTFLSYQDFDQIRNHLGEKVAFYFVFLQAYFGFLMVPAALGVICWSLVGQFSVLFSIVNSLACLVFVEYWKRQEIDLGLRWNVKGVSRISSKRKEFVPEKEVIDSVTGEKVPVFPARKRLLRQLLHVPFALVSFLALGTLIATCFAIEIFISEIYNGPFQTILAFIPTVLLSLLVPTISKVLTSVATQLNDYENYETQEAYDSALTRKIFALNFVTSYLPVLLTAFVYLPFAHVIVPYLDVFHGIVSLFQSADKRTKPVMSKFSINRSRLKKQVVYFAVTGQVVDFALETIVPYAKRRVLNKFQELSEEKKNGDSRASSPPKQTGIDTSTLLEDAPGEASFLNRVRNEAQLSDYDLTADLREMCVQFGYLAMFSPVWSLVPLFFLLNNWVELRSDFVKICIECKRPTPLRADSIGPWLDSMSFLAWLGSITSTALVYLFKNEDGVGVDIDEDGSVRDSRVKGWTLLLAIFFAEHGYLLVRMAVRAAMERIETPATRRDKAQRYMFRKKFLESMSGDERSADEQGISDVATGDEQRERATTTTTTAGTTMAETESVTRMSLEDEARNLSLHSTTRADLFWARQKGWKEVVQVGAGIIQATCVPQTKPEEKKEL
ncbi:hypothetical protein VTO42DRAFT_2345 [Malbranchea cinnamomea]